MIFTWDERKQHANIDKHQIDFASIDEEFFLSARRFPSRNGRLIAVGRMRERQIILVV